MRGIIAIPNSTCPGRADLGMISGRKESLRMARLARDGGPKVRMKPWPQIGKRFGEEELKGLKEALDQHTLFYTHGRAPLIPACVRRLQARRAATCDFTPHGAAPFTLPVRLCYTLQCSPFRDVRGRRLFDPCSRFNRRRWNNGLRDACCWPPG